ncbi:MAG: hypothetical protein A2452_06795 [Candidatus Firestonebacteria bacterium RIFOXYC2_FULL_39_67]|nr:MAG: hypothetical protein A2452_06795 [Candidatus Firestonebacteria bacterium RIFOXYC2_FULL_39_67]
MKNRDGIPRREYCNVPKRCANLTATGNSAVSYVGKGTLPPSQTAGYYCKIYPTEFLDDRNSTMIRKCNSCVLSLKTGEEMVESSHIEIETSKLNCGISQIDENTAKVCFNNNTIAIFQINSENFKDLILSIPLEERTGINNLCKELLASPNNSIVAREIINILK